MLEPSIGIVIVNYNGIKYQNECIRSIKKMNYSNYQIIVVDSGSSDGSIEKLEAEFDDIHILCQNENVGFAKGSNIGIQYSMKMGMKYTLLLNNDVELDENLFAELVAHADERNVTVPKIYFYDPSNYLWYAGGTLEWKIGLVKHTGWNKVDCGQYDTSKRVTYASACCMLIHNDIFESVGLLDERVFMYFEDTDFCVRLGEKGYNILYIPTGKMWHKASSSTGGIGSKIQTYYMKRNQLYYIKKHRSHMKWYHIPPIYLKDLIRAILSVVWRKNNRMIWVGYWDYFCGRMGKKELH